MDKRLKFNEPWILQRADPYVYDKEHGYDTCERLARIAKLSDDMSQDEIDAETDRAMDEIIFYDFLNIYKKVWQDSEPETEVLKEDK